MGARQGVYFRAVRMVFCFVVQFMVLSRAVVHTSSTEKNGLGRRQRRAERLLRDATSGVCGTEPVPRALQAEQKGMEESELEFQLDSNVLSLIGKEHLYFRS